MFDGEEIRCNGCHKILNKDIFSYGWEKEEYKKWPILRSPFKTIEYCRDCAINLPGAAGKEARMYFAARDKAKLLSQSKEKM